MKALELLGNELGYQLVGSNGVNAFFVRKDLAKGLFVEPATAENLYAKSLVYTRIVGHINKTYIGYPH
ncbi:hypothetical protein AGMMS50229_20030 [Campylobacterota bacterium]|nr:hypothetical protein AGMMS50229_20030 [Campylobacterota bacterium]